MRQSEILNNMQGGGYNVCTCGNCGDVVLMNQDMMNQEVIECPYCEESMEQCDMPDLLVDNF